jgi:bifunctional DNA-binding transcriptional regulator/antitoxin component of YhaV-PrlF toxin-antitoxin module
MEITTLAKQTSKSDSLRTTVPAGIVRQFELKEGDKIEWNIETRKNKLVIVVTIPKEEANE